VPVILGYNPGGFFEMSVALASSSPDSRNIAVANVNEAWERVFPELLIEYNFLDQKIANQYQFEDVMVKVMRFFAVMAIIICAIGLYGLTDYMANAKRKEIGIRKVVGASVGQIINIFTKEILIILVFAFGVSATATLMVGRLRLPYQHWMGNSGHLVGCHIAHHTFDNGVQILFGSKAQHGRCAEGRIKD